MAAKNRMWLQYSSLGMLLAPHPKQKYYSANIGSVARHRTNPHRNIHLICKAAHLLGMMLSHHYCTGQTQPAGRVTFVSFKLWERDASSLRRAWHQKCFDPNFLTQTAAQSLSWINLVLLQSLLFHGCCWGKGKIQPSSPHVKLSWLGRALGRQVCAPSGTD